MLITDDFSNYVTDLLSGTYDCVDRIALRGYFPLGQTSGGLLTWWNQLFPNTPLTEQRLRKLAGGLCPARACLCAQTQNSAALFCDRCSRIAPCARGLVGLTAESGLIRRSGRQKLGDLSRVFECLEIEQSCFQLFHPGGRKDPRSQRAKLF